MLEKTKNHLKRLADLRVFLFSVIIEYINYLLGNKNERRKNKFRNGPN